MVYAGLTLQRMNFISSLIPL